MKFAKNKIKVSPDMTFKEKYSGYDKHKDYAKWNANVGRKNRIARYKELAHLDEDYEITEKDIRPCYFDKVCMESRVLPERLRAELLGQKYSDLED